MTLPPLLSAQRLARPVGRLACPEQGTLLTKGQEGAIRAATRMPALGEALRWYGGASVVAFRDRRVRPSTGGRREEKRATPGGSKQAWSPSPAGTHARETWGEIRVGVCTTDRSASAVQVEGGAGPGPSSAGAKGRAWVPAQVSVVGYLLLFRVTGDLARHGYAMAGAAGDDQGQS